LIFFLPSGIAARKKRRTAKKRVKRGKKEKRKQLSSFLGPAALAVFIHKQGKRRVSRVGSEKAETGGREKEGKMKKERKEKKKTERGVGGNFFFLLKFFLPPLATSPHSPQTHTSKHTHTLSPPQFLHSPTVCERQRIMKTKHQK
jgi:hypothetical protein